MANSRWVVYGTRCAEYPYYYRIREVIGVFDTKQEAESWLQSLDKYSVASCILTEVLGPHV